MELQIILLILIDVIYRDLINHLLNNKSGKNHEAFFVNSWKIKGV